MSPTRNPFKSSESVKLATGIASGAILAGQAIKRTSTAGEFIVAGAGEKYAGIAWETAADGEEFPYALPIPGTVFGIGLSGAAIGSVNLDLAAAADGDIIPAVATDQVIGKSLNTTAGAGESVAIALEDGDRVAV